MEIQPLIKKEKIHNFYFLRIFFHWKFSGAKGEPYAYEQLKQIKGIQGPPGPPGERGTAGLPGREGNVNFCSPVISCCL